MELIKEMAASACLIGLALNAADILKPDEKFSSQIKMIFSLIFVLALAAPVAKSDMSVIINGSSTSDEQCSSEISEAAEKDMLYFIQKNTEKSLSEALSERNIDFSRIEAVIEINDDSYVSLKKVIVDAGNKTAAEKILRELTGEETEIVFTDEKSQIPE